MDATTRNLISVSEDNDLDIPNRNVLPYRHIRHLGSGGSAYIEMVEDTTTGQVFAHKRFHRYHGPNIPKFKQEVRNEIEVIRRLSSHPHIVRVFATYTCGREFGMILTPVADSDLATYLQIISDSGRPPTAEQCTILGRAFGCLTSGLAFIHERTIRHKDIKPQNILIHRDRIIYTDFGIALDASQHDSTTTVGTAQAFTRRYCAPEVARSSKRNRKSDIFSLGCVFTEILAVLEPRIKLGDLGAVLYHEVLDDLRDILNHSKMTSLMWSELVRVCLDMLEPEPEDRISAKDLLNEMSPLSKSKSNPTVEYFCNTCVPSVPEDKHSDALSSMALNVDQQRPQAPRRKVPTPSRPHGQTLTSSTGEAGQVVPFKYDQVTNSQTRLLKIYPGERNDDITVSISTVSIDDLGFPLHEYEALSYHWGAGLYERPIYVQDSNYSGQGKAKAIYITPNLYAALQHLRIDHIDVLMWVDAICINQDDRREKTAQVARMGEIYRRATRVCIWLGWGDESSYDAMRFIAEIVSSRTDDVFKTKKHIFRWQNLARLIRSAWFSRRWIIQEAALAREATVHYGREEIHWDDFRDGIHLFAHNFDTIRGLFEKSDEFLNISNPINELDILSAKMLVDFTSNFRNDGIFEPTLGLEYLVSTLSTFQCSEPRDTVFALQNIARETPRLVPAKGHHPPPEPDYMKGLFEVYRDFVRWVFQTSKSIDLICRYWALPERKRGLRDTLPSWIQMAGEGPGGKNGVSFVGLPGQPIYNASYREGPQLMFEVDRQQTHVSLPSQPWNSVAAFISYIPSSARPRVTSSTYSLPGTWPNDDPPAKPNDNAQSVGAQSPVLQSAPQPISSGARVTAKPKNPAAGQNLDLSLYIQGLEIGKITWTSEPIRDGVIPQSCLEKAGWPQSGGFWVPDKLWRTLVANRGPDGKLPPH